MLKELKVSILGGAGTLGATTAFVLAQQNLVDEISLIDLKENIAASHKMDMEQAAAEFSSVEITSGDFSLLQASDIIINTVGIPEKQVQSRMDYLEGNYKIIQQISSHINQYTKNPIIISATNPLDIIHTLLQDLVAIPKKRMIGFSLNDTFRFRWALSKVLQEPIENIEAFVFGEHGEDQIPIFSRIYINQKQIQLAEEQKQLVIQIIRNWFSDYQSLNSGRTSGWLSSINLVKIIKAIVEDTKEIITSSVIGKDGISIGQAARIGKNGVEAIEEIPLTLEETEEFNRVKQKINEQVKLIHEGITLHKS